MGWAIEHRESPAVTIARLEAEVTRLQGELDAERVAKAFNARRGATAWRRKSRIEVVEWDGNAGTIEPFLHSTTLRLHNETDLVWYDEDEWNPVPVGAFVDVTRVPYNVYMDHDQFLRMWEPLR